MLYFNTNKPQSFVFFFVFFFCRIPVVLENRRYLKGGVCTPCTLPLDLPLIVSCPEIPLPSIYVFADAHLVMGAGSIA